MENNLIKLLGRWESSNLNPGEEKVFMDFKENGELVYTIHSQEKKQIMHLIFRIEDNVIISNQPSHPKEERTPFIISDTELILEQNGEKSRFLKV